jgi:hypothetical protein
MSSNHRVVTFHERAYEIALENAEFLMKIRLLTPSVNSLTVP